MTSQSMDNKNPTTGHNHDPSKSKKMRLSVKCGEEDLRENVSSNLHPLLDIEMILETVFAHLEVNSSKAASLVCKTWFNIMRGFWIKKMAFRFNERSALQFLSDSEGGNVLPISVMNDFYNISRNPICVKLSMVRSDCDQYSQDELQVKRITYATAEALLGKFCTMNAVITELNLDICARTHSIATWKIITRLSQQLTKLNVNTNCNCSNCAHVIMHLHSQPDEHVVGRIEVADDQSFRQVIKKDTVTFPNLKVLSGEYRRFGSSDKIMRIFQKLLVSSPNLECLHCNLFSSHHDMFDVLLQNPDALKNLNSLSFVVLNQQELEMLLANKRNLKSLSMQVYSGFRVPVFYNFLSSQGEFLEKLEVDFMSFPTKPETFPCGLDLINLKHLKMKRFYGSIHFISHMPKLESFVLEQLNLSVALHDEASKYNYRSKLRSLKIFDGRGSTGRFMLPAVYHDIVSYFPELKHLRLEYLTDSTLKIIVKGLPHLEELDIPNGIYSDDVLICEDRSANKTEGCRKILMTEATDDQDAHGKVKSDQDGCDQIKSVRFADLKKLRKVVLQSPKITDVGILNGLARCRELRSISIDSPMISDKSLKLLSQDPDIQHLEFINCYQLTPEAISETQQLWGKSRSFIITNK